MTQPPTPRTGGRPWRRLCHRLKQDPANHWCWRCGGWIDTRIPWPDPMSWSGDHVIPLAHGGKELDPTNVRAAHLTHNTSHGATIRNTSTSNTSTSTNSYDTTPLPQLPVKDETHELWTDHG